MVMLEQTGRADWRRALEAALVRPPGVPERRSGEDPWAPPPTDGPRRATDDLAWLRSAMDDPGAFGLQPLTEDMRAWEVADADRVDRLERLAGRGILEAAGFALHHADAV